VTNTTIPQGEPISLPELTPDELNDLWREWTNKSPSSDWRKLVRLAEAKVRATILADRALGAASPDSEAAFKNFHRSLCARFGYVHDEKDWRRDQVSLEEHIARLVQPASPDVAKMVEAIQQGIGRELASANGEVGLRQQLKRETNAAIDALGAAATQARAAVPVMARAPLSRDVINSGFAKLESEWWSKPDVFTEGVRFAERCLGITADSARTAVGAEQSQGDNLPKCTYGCEAFPECGCVTEPLQDAIRTLNHVLDCLLRDSPDEIQASSLERAVAGLYKAALSAQTPGEERATEPTCEWSQDGNEDGS
jgi:hypothetical protein